MKNKDIGKKTKKRSCICRTSIFNLFELQFFDETFDETFANKRNINDEIFDEIKSGEKIVKKYQNSLKYKEKRLCNYPLFYEFLHSLFGGEGEI